LVYAEAIKPEAAWCGFLTLMHETSEAAEGGIPQQRRLSVFLIGYAAVA